MVMFPNIPEPRSTTPLPFIRPTVRSQFDGGAIATRAKYLNRRVVSLQLGYLGTMDEFQTLSDFWESVAGSALTFEFEYPYPQTIVQGTAGTPYTITTAFQHGYETGEQVSIGNVGGGIDGKHTITRVTPVQFTLDGTSGGIGVTSGLATRYFPRMGFVGDILGPFQPQFGFGAPVDDQGMLIWTLTLEER